MTRDDIIRMAREAGASFETAESMFRFAELVAAVEREACAMVCETEWTTAAEREAGQMFARGIRARGEKP